MRLAISLIIICTISLVSAVEIKDIIKENNNFNKEYIVNYVDAYVESEIKYKFNWDPQSPWKTWKTKQGDCTDKTILKTYILNYFDIETRLVHGFYYGEKHDWFEYNINNTWYSMEEGNKKIGYGVW